MKVAQGGNGLWGLRSDLLGLIPSAVYHVTHCSFLPGIPLVFVGTFYRFDLTNMLLPAASASYGLMASGS